MRRLLTLIVALLATTSILSAQQFDANFSDSTLRLDYTFMGNASEQYIALRDITETDGWWGRRVNLGSVPLKGNGDLTLSDSETGEVIYKTSFSSLFQEWITTPEASSITRSFEFTILVPKPKKLHAIPRIFPHNARQ